MSTPLQILARALLPLPPRPRPPLPRPLSRPLPPSLWYLAS